MITENSIILDVLRNFPQSMSVFAKYGLKCLG